MTWPVPTTSDDPLGETWERVISESPWSDVETERRFEEMCGVTPDEASLADMRPFLGRILQTKQAGAA